MFCKHCGAPLDSDSTFCTRCGAGIDVSAADSYAQPVQAVPVQPVNPAGPSATKVMVFGIIGLALCELGLPGVILSAIALRLANEFIQWNGGLFGQAKVGRILGKIGFIVGIVMTVFWLVYIVAIVGLVSWGIAHYY